MSVNLLILRPMLRCKMAESQLAMIALRYVEFSLFLLFVFICLSVLIKFHKKAGISVPLERGDYVKQGTFFNRKWKTRCFKELFQSRHSFFKPREILHGCFLTNHFLLPLAYQFLVHLAS